MLSQRSRVSCLIIGVIILGCFAAFFLYPHSLKTLEGNITLVSIPNDVTVHDFTAYPSGAVVAITISQDDSDYKALTDCLSGLKYTYCIHSLSKAFPDESQSSTFLLETGEHTLYFSGENHIEIDGTVYRLKETNLYDLCRMAAKSS